MGEGRFAVLMPEMDEKSARSWVESLRGSWNVGVVWAEIEQRIGVDIGFSVDAIAPGKEGAVAVLDGRLKSLMRKWYPQPFLINP